ncbi:histidinol-phosphate transaminase activity protein [[Candida] boidinii]|nr:histidinol-phosphate transaminase activity protein [[Candida] boidinii]OWB62787.1 histidinol-phosphate transaminase activity protein [[Candida] boidinii]
MVFDISKIIRPNILTLEPYRCARDDFKEGLLLDANENTHGPAIVNINSKEESLELNRYPDPHQVELKNQIVEFRNSECEKSQLKNFKFDIPNELKINYENLCLGVGSDESIDALIRCCIKPGVEKMLICPPTYGMYSICAIVNDVKEIVKVPLNFDNFQVNKNLLFDTISKDETIKLIYITSPGNPTGKLIDLNDIIEILNKIEEINWNGLLILDEAYIDFSPIGSSLSVLVNKYKKLVVLQTLSKSFGLAGIRLGITFASKEISRVLNSMKYPYNISNLTSDIAMRSTTKESLKLMRKNCELIINQREIVLKNLLNLKGIGKNIGGLDSNFLLLQIIDKNGEPNNELCNKVYKNLAIDNSVVVRFRGNEPGCNSCLRITIGTEEENKILISKFEKVLNELL